MLLLTAQKLHFHLTLIKP